MCRKELNIEIEKNKWQIQQYINKEGIVFANGCGHRNCPCRLWIQCSRYVDIEEQQKRLKRKADNDYKLVHSWYETNFRIKYEYPDSFGNG